MLNGACHCGSVAWKFADNPGSVTACNCSLCRRYGAIWAYGYEGEKVAVRGNASAYRRKDDPGLEILFCPNCSCVIAWRALQLEEDGRRAMAVNVRLAPPDTVAHIPIDHFDGLKTFADLPGDGRLVRDLWS